MLPHRRITPVGRKERSIVPARSEYERLLEEVRLLQMRITELTALRDDLVYHICPALRAEYEEKIVSLERELLAAQMYLREKQRIVELLQAQINRQKMPSIEEAERDAREEFKEYEEDLKKKAEEASQSRERWEKETKWSTHDEAEKKARDREKREREKEAKQSARDGAEKKACGKERIPEQDPEDGKEAAAAQPETPLQRIKWLYRNIVKRLHPDVNPDLTPHEKELWNRAAQAHERGDLEALEQIWDELCGMDAPEEKYEDTEEGRARLRELLEKLKARCRSLTEEITRIRSDFPYKYKAFLDDPAAVEAKRKSLQENIDKVREMDRQMTEYIEKLRETIRQGSQE